MNQLEVLLMIKREMENRHITAAELSRGLRMNPSSVSGMLNRSTIQVNRLVELSSIFKYNFFREIAEKLPYAEPNFTDQTEVKVLQNRIRDLELEVGILRQTIKDLVSR